MGEFLVVLYKEVKIVNVSRKDLILHKFFLERIFLTRVSG